VTQGYPVKLGGVVEVIMARAGRHFVMLDLEGCFVQLVGKLCDEV
jgi:hypothetical protein